MAIVLHTFGDSYQCVQRFLTRYSNKPHLLQVHISNETCRRVLGRCTKHEIAPHKGVHGYNQLVSSKNASVRKDIHRRVSIIQTKIKPLLNPNTKLLVSTGLEDNYDTATYKQIVSWIREKDETITLVRNPVSKTCSSTSGAKFCELHLPDAVYPANKGCIWNNDGNINTVREQLSLFRRFSSQGCSVLFAWEPASQGRGIVGDQFVEPRSRTFFLPARTVKEYRKLFNEFYSEIH